MKEIVLLTGFAPFGKYRRNPTGSLVREMDGFQLNCGVTIKGEVLPCSYSHASEGVIRIAKELSPKIILSLGYASRIPQIRVETRGRNEKRSPYFDSDGIAFSGTPIEIRGPKYADTSANNPAIVRAIRRDGARAELSHDAERFVCNCLIYTIGRCGLDIPFCYMHIPAPASFADLIEGQTDKITIPDEHVLIAVLAAINTMLF